MTHARERALRLCDSHYHVRRSTGPCSYCTLIEREILAAERAAVEAFAKQATSDFALLTRLDVGAIVVGEAVALINGRLEAWLRSRGDG